MENKIKTVKSEVAVIVGRFQTPYLHDGHKEILAFVVDNHPRVFVFLGQTPLKCTTNDPLDFNTRKAMIEAEFPTIEVHRIDDVGDDNRWSRDLDRQIKLLTGPFQTVTLYGSRDSFINSYTGKFPTEELRPSRYVSASEIRKEIGIKSKKTREFREGAVWALQNQWPKVYATVDIAVVNPRTQEVLLVRKPTESLYRFPGGFSDTNTGTFEDDAVRELQEETQLIADNIVYIGSTLIADWRYKRQEDKIKTLFFAVTEFQGIAVPDDDLAGGEIQWKKIGEIKPSMLVSNHQILLDMLIKWKERTNLLVK